VAALQAEVVRLGELARSAEAARGEAARAVGRLQGELGERDTKLAAVERLALAKSGEAGKARGEAERAANELARARAEVESLRGEVAAAEKAAEELRAGQKEAGRRVRPS
jgi:chromosome segregation ATPase